MQHSIPQKLETSHQLSEGIAVDIDDTLCETSLNCMSRMLKQFGTIQEKTAQDLWQLHKQPGLVPDWQHATAQKWIARLFHNEAFLLELPPVSNAPTCLAEIHKRHPVKYYITSRTPNLTTVTKQWLEKHHFPAAPIIMRKPEVRSTSWKLEHFASQSIKLYAIIDNEHTSLFSDASPSIQHYIHLNRYGKGAVAGSEPHGKIIRSFSTWKEISAFLI